MSASLDDAEQSLIGCALLRADVLDVVEWAPADFFDPRLRLIATAMARLHAERRPLDPLVVSGEFPEHKHGEIIALLSECVSAMPTADNAEHYAAILRDAALKRALCDLGVNMRDDRSGAETLDATWAALSALVQRKEPAARSIGDVALAAIRRMGERVEERQNGAPNRALVPTGLRDVDSTLGGGLPVGVVTVEGGRPGTGKSSLARQVALNTARAGHGVHVFSLEDREDVYGDRLLADLADVDLAKLRTGVIDAADGSRVLSAGGLVQKFPWLIDDRAGLSSVQIAMAVRRHRRDLDTRLVVVDYVQLMREPQAGHRAIEQVGAALKGLVRLAREESVSVLLLSQLNRDSEREERRPQMRDLRESGELEQDARVILFTHHWRDKQGSRTGKTEIIVAKNTNGVGEVVVEVGWDGSRTRYSDLYAGAHPNAPGQP